MKILLYNPISGHGHLDSWNAMFAETLLNEGHQVAAITPDATILEGILARRARVGSGKIRILPWEQENMMDALAQKDPEWAMARNAAAPQEPSHWLSPLEAAARINAALASSGGADFIFITYMDMYPRDEAAWTDFGRFVHTPWGGVVFNPAQGPEETGREGYYRLTACRGMCFLDAASETGYGRAMPERIFHTLPDITDGSLPGKTPEIVLHMKEKAAGRRIALLGGSLDSRKNIGGFCEMAARADPDRYLFALVGRHYESTFSESDKKKLAIFMADARSNTFLWPDYVPDERDLNAIFMASDVIFAVYRNFPGSSNMLAKAAAFEKPLLVSDQYRMGALTRRYRLGLAVPECDPGMAHALAALARLESMSREVMGFAAYRRDFPTQAMAPALSSFIRRCVEKAS